MELRTLSLPKLNNLKPTLESTMIKLQEECGELAQVVGKLRNLSGETNNVDKKEVAEKLLLELLDVAQVAVSMTFVIEEEYDLDINAGVENHINKLFDKKYITKE